VEIEAVAQELEDACGRLEELGRDYSQAEHHARAHRGDMDEMIGILEHSALETREAWIRDLFERIEVDAQERHVLPVWRAATDQEVDWVQ
jgi:hypothetical protein